MCVYLSIHNWIDECLASTNSLLTIVRNSILCVVVNVKQALQALSQPGYSLTRGGGGGGVIPKKIG